MTRNPRAIARRIRNAGAVFLGHHTPETLGDYLAGPSHVLPTGGTARFASGLSVHHFLRRRADIESSGRTLAAMADDLVTLARAEGLEAHARSAAIRDCRGKS